MAQNNPKMVSASDLMSWLDAGKPMVVLDILFKDRYERKHIEGAIQACVFEVGFMNQVKEAIGDLATTVVVYGSSDGSMDARTASEKLFRAGYSDVRVLEGGFAEWQAAGLPVAGADATHIDPPHEPIRIADGAYVVDTEGSTVVWAGRNPNSTHQGTVALSRGAITVQNGEISGLFELDMKSIRNSNLEGSPAKEVLEEHLKSDDFFFASLFPKARFTMTKVAVDSVAPSSSVNSTVTGDFEMRGVHKELSFPATVAVKPDGGIAVEAHFDVDRTRWNIIYGSSRFFEHLGMHMIFDNISIELRILALT
ncbi:MAG: hypothetical protein HOH43_03200 [Candidatus Latescibacteria bacterium]|nr:hypothetical protein [Candidatus Latescibacterota bacterium]